ncbi:HNH endonuclease [Sporosarcina sp. E16_8]|uniref:HNH endonuclease n=1 Tax=Sporosarcina sp. E16_8 TaxID=2789295 RepID=UPI001A9128F8|nr:HNH endonuclease [Sporosarcina sp. E16_8]MBO0586127.1 HNH endonuclease [Sporosarcina sp. E16_8]
MKKPLKPCNYPMCSKLTRSGYCEDHTTERTVKNAEYDKFARDKVSNAFYQSKAWKIVRGQALMRDNGLCQHCVRNRVVTAADMVDHIVPLKEENHLKDVLSNLQSLCNRCHAIKTANDKKIYKR